MKTFLILLSVIPIFAGLVVANLFGFRRLYKSRELSIDLETILELLAKKYNKLHYEFQKSTWAGTPLNKLGVAMIDEKYRHSKSTRDVAFQLIRLGLSGLWDEHKKLIIWRVKCVKMGYILPPLTILGVSLGIVVSRIPVMWAIVVVGAVIASCICFLWFSRAVEKEAALQIVSLIERTRPLNRLSEEEDLIDNINAWTWVNVLPGIAISFLMKKEPVKSANKIG